MTRISKNWTALTIGLVLGAALYGCKKDEGSGAGDGDGDGDTGGSSSGGAESGGSSSGGLGGMGDGGATGGMGGNDGSGGGSTVNCAPPDTWWGEVPAELVSTTPYVSGTGIDLAIAAAPATDETVDLSGDPIQITDATVAAVGYYASGNPDQLWLENASGAIRTAFIDPGVVVEVGDRVSLQVTELTNFNGLLQITDVTGFTVSSSEELVYVREWNDVESDELKVSTLYHGYGEVSMADVECGIFECYTLSTERGDVFFRGEPDMEVGDCVQFVAPLRQAASNVQLDGSNFAWARTY